MTLRRELIPSDDEAHWYMSSVPMRQTIDSLPKTMKSGSNQHRFRIFYIEDITCLHSKKHQKKFCSSKNNIYICHAQGAIKPQAGRKVKRESGANPEQFLLLCISTLLFRVWFIAIFATGNNWEGAINGMSQKTYLGAFEGLYLQDTGVNQNCFNIIVF